MSNIDPGTGMPVASVAARLNRLPVLGVHRFAVAVVGVGLFFDLYEVFLAGTLGAVLQRDFGLHSAALKAVLASAFVGQFVGALVFGRVADRFGRRTTFLLNLGIYSLFSIVAVVSPNAAVLAGARFLAGIGLGSQQTLGDTYLSDILPTRSRGRWIAAAYTIGFLGVPVAGLLARQLVPVHPLGFAGWRWLFLIGGLGAFVVLLIQRGLPESPRWLESVGRTVEARAMVSDWEHRAEASVSPLPEPSTDVDPATADRPVRASAGDGRGELWASVSDGRSGVLTLFRRAYRRRTIMLWLLNGLEVFGYYGFGTIAPLVLAAKGYSVVGSLTYIALTYLGYPVGSALSVPIIERLERKFLIALSAAGMAVTGISFGIAGSALQVVVCGVLFTMISNVFSNAFHVYLAELYPTTLRATAAGSAYSISRLATAALPYALLPVLDRWGGGPVFTVVAAAMVALIIVVLTLGPRSTGRDLEAVGRGRD